MSQRKKSKEELFLIKLYEFANKAGGPEEEIDRYLVGEALGWHTKSIDHIVQLLSKINFVKKGEDAYIYLTSAGAQLAAGLKKE